MNNEKLSKISDYLITSLLLFLVVFTPLAFGTVQPWSIFIFRITTALLSFAFLFQIYLTRKLYLRETYIYLPVVLFVAVVLFQLLPLPAFLLKLLSFGSFEFHNSLNSFIPSGNSFFGAISLNPYATKLELLQFACYCLILFIVLNHLRSLKQINLILSVILITGFLISLFGIIQRFTWTGKIFWFQEIPVSGNPFGPFVNYDHFGGYINMIILIGLGFVLSDIESSKKTLIGFMAVIMSACLMLSRSRGAVIAFLISLVIFLAIFFIVRKKYPSRVFVSTSVSIFAVIMFILMFIYWIDWGLFIGRMKSISLEGNFFYPRFNIWDDSSKIIKDFLLTGAGYGTYSYIFPKYQKTFTDIFWRNAHNDYLQLLIETGPSGIILAFSFLFLVFRQALKKIYYTQNKYLMGLLIGGTISVTTMIFHSFVDFNSHITSNAFLLCMIIGLMLSLSFISRNPEIKNVNEVGIKPKTAAYILVFGSVLIVFLLVIPSVRIYLADVYDAKAENSNTESNLKTAIMLTPDNAVYRHELGLYYEKQASAEKDIKNRITLLNLSKKELEKAIKLSPSSAFYWASYGWLLGNLGQKDKGLGVFSRALELAPNRPQINDLFRKYLTDIYSNKKTK